MSCNLVVQPETCRLMSSIHMGGIYGDKETTLARFKENYRTKLSDGIKARLVLENDEICYNVDDLLPVCNELEIPMYVPVPGRD